MKVFQKLTKTHVNIGCGDGTSFRCPMLPVGALPEYREASDMIRNAKAVGEFEAGRERLLALCRNVFPADRAPLLERFDLGETIELASYLMFGFGDSEPETEAAPVLPAGDEKKSTPAN